MLLGDEKQENLREKHVDKPIGVDMKSTGRVGPVTITSRKFP